MSPGASGRTSAMRAIPPEAATFGCLQRVLPMDVIGYPMRASLRRYANPLQSRPRMAVNLPAPDPASLLPVPGIDLGVAMAGVRKADRKDLLVMRLAEGSAVSGSFGEA